MTSRPFSCWGGLKLSSMFAPFLSSKLRNFASWAEEIFSGVMKLIQLTISIQPGVVREPA